MIYFLFLAKAKGPSKGRMRMVVEILDDLNSFQILPLERRKQWRFQRWIEFEADVALLGLLSLYH